MILASLPFPEIQRKLQISGLDLRLGPFSFRIKSHFPSISESLYVLYADYEVVLDADDQFLDFHISVDSPSLSRKFCFKQAQFFFDGYAPFNSLPYQHAPALIEWGMNWCVSSQINTHLIIHAAVIEKGGYAAILPAPPGSGKSTLTASLIQEGWRLLSDELTLIDLHAGLVLPFPRPVSLKNQSIDIIAKRYPDVVFGPLSTDTSKGTVCHAKPPGSSVQKQFLSCPVAWVIFPKYEEGAETEFVFKSKARAFIDIADNSFNYSRLGVSGFNVLRDVIDSADCYQLCYSQLDEAVQIFNALKPKL